MSEKTFSSKFDLFKNEFLNFVALQPQYEISVDKINFFTKKIDFRFSQQPSQTFMGLGSVTSLLEIDAEYNPILR